MITWRKCFQCGWVNRHAIRWCANCGSVLRIVEGSYEDYLKDRQFLVDAEWQWSNAKFDPIDGKPVIRETK